MRDLALDQRRGGVVDGQFEELGVVWRDPVQLEHASNDHVRAAAGRPDREPLAAHGGQAIDPSVRRLVDPERFVVEARNPRERLGLARVHFGRPALHERDVRLSGAQEVQVLAGSGGVEDLDFDPFVRERVVIRAREPVVGAASRSTGEDDALGRRRLRELERGAEARRRRPRARGSTGSTAVVPRACVGPVPWGSRT